MQGDRIESSMSAYITLSTMGAAALGNTISDVIGIGSSYYVERAAILVGLGGPALSPVQLDMPVSRRFANAVSVDRYFPRTCKTKYIFKSRAPLSVPGRLPFY